MNCRTDVLKDFDSRTEAMGLKCPYSNAESINNLASLAWEDPSLRRGIIAYSIGTYTTSDSAPVRIRIRPRETINDCANI